MTPVLAILAALLVPDAAGDAPVLWALRGQESVHGSRPSGDHGASRGDWHVGRAYHEDGMWQRGREGLPTWTYEAAVTDPAKSIETIRAYWRRYERAAWCRVVWREARPGDVEALARVHQGGPSWRTTGGTRNRRHWAGVRAWLAVLPSPSAIPHPSDLAVGRTSP